MTLGGELQARASEIPGKPYFHYEDTVLTYGEINSIVNRVANGLISLGAAKGDKVCLLLTNIPEFVYSMYGSAKAGAVFCPINPALRGDEVAYILDNSDARILIVEESHIEMIRGIKDRCPSLEKVILVGSGAQGSEIPFEKLTAGAPDSSPSVAVDGSDIAAIIYTSGTTGKPKGAMLTHGNYCWDAKAMASFVNMTSEDRFMCILPLFHVNGQVVTTLAPMVSGASMVLVRRFSATTFFQTVDRYKPTAFSAVPTIYAMLLNTPGAEGYDLSSLRFCVCGAAPMPVEVINRFEEKFNATILEGYGLSEGTCVSSVNPVEGARKVGSIGVALPGQEMKIVDAQGEALPPGQTGEIVIKGPNVMLGYYKNEEATASAIVDGWLHTGDLGNMDADGYFFIAGRSKEMIIRGGENIYPKEIEEVVYTHPAVADAAVCGVPDKFYGEEVKVFIVLKPGAAASEQDILGYCAERLAKYKCPKSAAFLDEMPKTATGKIMKRKLVEDAKWTAE